MYRDGISDGELKIVEETELRNLQKSFECYHENYSPMLTYIIVQKRINTRVFQVISILCRIKLINMREDLLILSLELILIFMYNLY